MYAREEARIRSALGARVLAVDHVGSTAVPGLPAKDRIDIDLIVADPAAEDAYVPALASTGYTLRPREPHWYEHRCLWNADHSVNLHVFGPDCDEYLRHVIFRDSEIPGFAWWTWLSAAVQHTGLRGVMLVQRVVTAVARRESWTVLGDDGIPVAPVERYLAYLSDAERSPNTVKAYAHDLKDWFEFLAGAGLDWQECGWRTSPSSWRGCGGRRSLGPVAWRCCRRASITALSRHQLTYTAVYDLVKRLRRRTGIDFDPHWYRHTYATRLLRAGTPVEMVSKLLGHACITTTADTYPLIISL